MAMQETFEQFKERLEREQAERPKLVARRRMRVRDAVTGLGEGTVRKVEDGGERVLVELDRHPGAIYKFSPRALEEVK
jgi:hypothetical protein